jgi:DNA-binding LacI/PurR family transcriptional regulator
MRFRIPDNCITPGLPYLKKCGYRHIGLIFSKNQGDARQVVESYLPQLPKPSKISYFASETNHSEEGMEMVIKQITSANAPEALFVLNDNLCRGVVMGLLAKGLTFPDKIGLLTHANEGITILSPSPLTRIEYSPVRILHQNIDRVVGSLSGESLLPGANMVSLIEGLSCKQTKGEE